MNLVYESEDGNQTVIKGVALDVLITNFDGEVISLRDANWEASDDSHPEAE